MPTKEDMYISIKQFCETIGTNRTTVSRDINSGLLDVKLYHNKKLINLDKFLRDVKAGKFSGV